MAYSSFSESFLNGIIKEGVKVKVDKKNLKLLANIELFKKECLKRKIYPLAENNYGVGFLPHWYQKYGFIYNLNTFEALHLMRKDTSIGITFEQLLQAEKKQIQIIRKARHNLACLIRLKQRLGLPGPIQKITTGCGYGLWDYPVVVSQEEIDEILKY